MGTLHSQNCRDAFGKSVTGVQNAKVEDVFDSGDGFIGTDDAAAGLQQWGFHPVDMLHREWVFVRRAHYFAIDMRLQNTCISNKVRFNTLRYYIARSIILIAGIDPVIHMKIFKIIILIRFP